MDKTILFPGQPILSQLLFLIPRPLVRRLARENKADRYCKNFDSYAHLVTMLFSAFQQCTSLREVITGMQAHSTRLAHLGLRSTPRRSTLADANKRRPAVFFGQLFHQLYARYYGSLPDSMKGKSPYDRLFIIDSTTIELFSSLMQGTGVWKSGKTKGAIKAHVVLKSSHDVPCFVKISQGKVSDHQILSLVHLPQGSIVVFDRGYRNYSQFRDWTQEKITWVTRAYQGVHVEIKQDRPLSEKQVKAGVIADHEVELGHKKHQTKQPTQRARMVIFQDPVSTQRFEFLTNNFRFAPSTIADLYKKRWQIELLFKRIKQNFQLQYFLGDTENAIQIQLWCALIADLLIKIVRDKVAKRKKWSMANLSGLIRLHLNTYIHLYNFLINPDKALLGYKDPMHEKQLSLFDQKIRGA